MMMSERRLRLVSTVTSSRFGVIHTHAQRPSRVLRLNHPMSHHPGTAVPATRQRNNLRALLDDSLDTAWISSFAT
jgi:hypothetical protein